MAQASVSAADEIKVLCSTPLKHVMEALVPPFERATKHQVIVTYGPSPELKKKIDGGAPFDLAVLTPALMDGVSRASLSPTAQARTLASPATFTIRGASVDKPAHGSPPDSVPSQNSAEGEGGRSGADRVRPLTMRYSIPLARWPCC